jgi:GAF domain-containing protein
LPVRTGDVRLAPRYYPIHPDFRSELAVPLKYRGRIIGALVLVSSQPNAFSQPDEQLLIVIASQMAGLFENMRLNEETRERAQKLADSVRQLQAVRDTSLDIAGDLDLDTLLSRLTYRARDLVGARGAELGLYNEREQIIEIVVSDTPWENVQGIHIPLMAGVAGRLAAFGEPIVVKDYNTWPGRLLPHRKAAFQAVAGVPLKFKGQVIGTLTVLDDRPEKTYQSEDGTAGTSCTTSSNLDPECPVIPGIAGAHQGPANCRGAPGPLGAAGSSGRNGGRGGARIEQSTDHSDGICGVGAARFAG